MGNKRDCNDVKVFFSEWQRMCEYYGSSISVGQCPLHTYVNNGCGACVSFDVRCVSGEKLDHLVRIMQKWSDEHPVEIDWLKVPPNTPVLVRTKDSHWTQRYFVAYLPNRPSDNKFAVFNNCSIYNPVSQEEAVGIDYYYECKLADSVDPTPYYKEVSKYD